MRETKFWTWHMFAGVLILVLLGGHMVYTHMGELTGFMREHDSDGISIENSQARDARTLFPFYFVVLLGVALYHGLYGLRTILFELCPHPPAQRIMSALLLILGIALFCLGSFSAFKAHGNAVANRSGAPPAQARNIERGR